MTIERVTSKDFRQITGYNLSNTSQLKLFPILRDIEDNEMFVNIFRAYTVWQDTLADASYFTTYASTNQDWFDNIAYKMYSTPDLWWMVCLVNDIINPFESLNDGDLIQVLRPQFVPQFVREVEAVGDL
jgi:hypothetical protein